jgi:hypothetical protein
VEELVDFKKRDKEADNMIAIQERCLKLRKKLGKTVRKRGGNCIISYRQVLDNEGSKSKRIVIRGYGTAAFITPKNDIDGNYGGLNSFPSRVVPWGLLKAKSSLPYVKSDEPRTIPPVLEERPRV